MADREARMVCSAFRCCSWHLRVLFDKLPFVYWSLFWQNCLLEESLPCLHIGHFNIFYSHYVTRSSLLLQTLLSSHSHSVHILLIVLNWTPSSVSLLHHYDYPMSCLNRPTSIGAQYLPSLTKWICHMMFKQISFPRFVLKLWKCWMKLKADI